MKADKSQITRLLKTARGQIDGILGMIEEDRYCIDVSTQLMATQAILAKANKEILLSHIECCIKNATEEGDKDKKTEELTKVIEKLFKQ